MKKNTWLVRPMVLAVGSCFSVAPAFANPTAPQIMHGSVQMQGLGSASLKVTNSPGSIIHWQGFSIGAGEVTQFIQQSAASAVLNRVVGANISQIHGQLLSNGRVFLINPAGILIGAGAVIDTAGFVGSTLRMQDADFLSGKLRFQGDAGAGSITNQGWIKAGQGGNVVLIAPDIQNSGIIQTEGGQIVLAAGRKMTIGSLDFEGVQFEIQAPTDSVLNVGKLLADGGAVGVFAGTLKHTGDIRANALVRDAAGRIVLQGQGAVTLAAGSTTKADGGSGGDVRIQSTSGHTSIAGDVSATGSAGQGGDILVLGNRVSLVENASLNASGSTGGGQIRFGGDYQGLNAALPNASRAFVGQNASMRADAGESGDGGRIIVWADNTTQYYGSLSARGGAQGGNGGFAEVSGKDTLIFTGGADLSAARGRQGTLLLDPLDLYVDARGGSITSIIDEASDVPENAVTISPAALAAMSADVKLHARRYMRFSDPVVLTKSGQSLTALVDFFPAVTPEGSPPNRMDIAADITTAGGAVTLRAPTIQSVGLPTIRTAGGAITLDTSGLSGGGATIIADGLTLDAGAGAVTTTAAESFVSLGNITGGRFTARAQSSITTGTVNTAGGPVDINSTESDIRTGTIMSGGGFVLLESPMSQVIANGIESGAGSVTINALSRINPGSVTTTGGAVNLTSVQSSINVFGTGISAGSGPVMLSGTNINTATIDTTNTVSLTATNGSIFSTVNRASSLNASALRQNGFSNISIGQTDAATPLNATSVIATATGCNFNNTSCNGASVNLNATGTVNVGAVRAVAPVSGTGNTNSSVSINSSQGSIQTLAGSQITGVDVTLGTGQLTGGGIGTPAAPMTVDARRAFTISPNGAFEVVFNDTGAAPAAQPGPIQLAANVGVAPTGQSFSGALRSSGGNVLLSASADAATVTLNTLPTSGFDQRVHNSTPFISFHVPNGALNAPSLMLAAGSADPDIGLNVALSSSGNATLGTYTRQGTGATPGRSTSVTSTAGMVSIGTLNGNNDRVSISGPLGVTISGTSVTTTGSVDVSSTSGPINIGKITSGGTVNVSSDSGNITVGQIDNASGSGVTLQISCALFNNCALLPAVVGAAADTGAFEVVSGGSVSVTGRTIGTAGFSNPLDLQGSSVTLTSRHAAGAIGFANPPSTSGPANAPIFADTTDLTINAATDVSTNATVQNRGARFNVTTGAKALQNLRVTANPGGVDPQSPAPEPLGALGQVRTEVGAPNERLYVFESLRGVEFRFNPGTVAPTQFAGGLLSFTSNFGDITLGNTAPTNLGPTGGIDISALAGSINATSIDARSVVLNANTSGVFVTSPNVHSITTSTVGGVIRPDSIQFTAGNTQRRSGSVTTSGPLNPATDGSVSIITHNGGITIGGNANDAIGSAAFRPGSVALTANDNQSGVSGSVRAGNVFANTINASSRRNAVGGGADFNLDALSSIALASGSSISTGTLNAPSISISRIDFGGGTINPSVATGAIGGVGGAQALQSLFMSNVSSVTVGGAITADATAADSISIFSSGAVTIGGAVTAGPASSISLTANNGLLTLGGAPGGIVAAGDGSFISLHNGSATTGLSFSTLDAGIGGSVNVNSSRGITQTTTRGGPTPNSGIIGRDIALTATGGGTPASGTITNSADAGGVDLIGVANLSISASGSVALDANGSTLTDLGIAKSSTPTAAPFTIANLGSGQVFLLGTVPSDATLSVNSPGSPLNFTFDYTAPGAGLSLATPGIVTQGGSVTIRTAGMFNGSTGGITTGGPDGGGSVFLSSSGGSVTTGAINTTPTGALPASPGSAIDVRTTCLACDIIVSGNLTTGAIGSGGQLVSLSANNGSITQTGGSRITADAFVTVTALNGDIGTLASPLLVTTPTTTLIARGPAASAVGTVFAGLTGTTTLSLEGGNGFNVTSDVAFTSLTLATRGSGQGTPGASTLNLAAPNQTYQFGRPTTDVFGAAVADTFEIVTAAGTAPVPSPVFRTTDKHLMVKGGANLTSPNLTLQASAADGDILLQGRAGSPLALTNATQFFDAGRSLIVAGKVTLSGGTQTLRSNFGGISLLGGAASDEAVLVTADTFQLLETPTFRGGDFVFRGGGDRSSVIVRYTGADAGGFEQQIQTFGSLQLQGGPGNDSLSAITSVAGEQRVRANGNMLLTGGAGADAIARIEHTGAGNQQIGESLRFCCTFTQPYQTDDITLQGGSGLRSRAEILSSASQQILSRGGMLSLLGGSERDTSARIEYTGTDEQRIGFPTYLNGFPFALGGLVLQGGAGVDAFARISSATGLQRITPTGTVTVAGGTAAGTFAKIASGGSQNFTGPNNRNVTLSGGGTEAAPVANAGATIEGHSQFVSCGSNCTLTLNGGAGVAGSPSDAVLRNLSGNQIVRAGTIVLNGGHANSTTGIFNPAGVGTQEITANNGGITLRSHIAALASAPVIIENLGTPPVPGVDETLRDAQTITGFRGVALDNRGTGLVGITSSDTQAVSATLGGITIATGSTGNAILSAAGHQTVGAQFVDVMTSAGSTGDALLSAGGNQRIRTTNGTAGPASLRAAAIGAGLASIQAGAKQLLEVDYFEVATGGGAPPPGSMVIGDATGLGTSRIHAVDQSVFARSITVQGGAGAAATSRLSGVNTQHVSTLRGLNDPADGISSVLGGSGAGATATIEAPTQSIVSAGDFVVRGGSGASASITANTQALNVTAGMLLLDGGTVAGSSALVSSSGSQSIGFASLLLRAGTQAGSDAKIDSAGPQTLSGGNMTLQGNAAGASALIQSTAPQTISGGNMLLTGGTGAASLARITTPGAQTLLFNSLTLNGGTAGGANARIDSGAAQSLNGGNISLSGVGALASIDSAGSQLVNTSGTLSLLGGNAGSTAQIMTAAGQTFGFNSLTMTGGAAGSVVQLSSPSTQTLNGGSGPATLIANGGGVSIAGHSQTFSCGAACNFSLTGASGADAVLRNLSGAQSVTAGIVTLNGGPSNSTTGIINDGADTQSVRTTGGGIFLRSHADAQASASLAIRNTPATAQTIAANGHMVLDSRGAGGVVVSSGGTQSIDAIALDVVTFPGTTLNGATASVTAVGEQTIHTSHSLPGAAQNGVGLRVASLSTGTAKIESRGNQTLNIGHPERVQGQLLIGRLDFGPPGIGNPAAGNPAAGNSLVLATGNQIVNAGSLYIQGPTAALRISELSTTGAQTITTFVGGVSLVGGSGLDAFASIDPTSQAINAFGPILLQGGSGPNADALINATGPQSVLSQTGAVTLLGGSGPGADARIVTTSPIQNVFGQQGVILSQGPLGGGVASLQQGQQTTDVASGLVAAGVLRERDELDDVEDVLNEPVSDQNEGGRARGRAQTCS